MLVVTKFPFNRFNQILLLQALLLHNATVQGAYYKGDNIWAMLGLKTNTYGRDKSQLREHKLLEYRINRK